MHWALTEVVQEVGERTGLCVVLDAAMLRENGIETSLEIDVERHNSLLDGMRLGLRQSGLDVIVRDGCIVVTTGACASDMQYRDTLSLAQVLTSERNFECLLREIQTVVPESVWKQVDGVGGDLVPHPAEKTVEVTQTAWVLWQLEQWLKSEVDKSR
ncbi:MAG: hypothetical protein ACKV2Q_35000 [Planctomycetaceae bacterium]